MGGETGGDGGDEAQEGENGTDGAADAGNETTATETEETAENETAENETVENETAGNETTGNESDVEGTVGEQSQQDLEIDRHSYFQRDGESGVEGVIRNTGDTTYELVTVHVAPRADESDDSAREYPEQQEEYRDTLAPDATWEFEVVFDAPEGRSPDSYVVWVTGREDA
ncbi:hypothetical protein [Haloprofundus sp. MHR1]|uniref:hypothetical protein n=1 Tax=Haloprofundus sp. MHR1 TaxID=2572921 RepID=UPI0010BE31B3|nr:hypothetical protein [Haloprofundus sp. MHR1]QCJ46936.1 hypothetical protein FCF25_07350 [Haloprofundus sp. MHR1]